MKKVVCGQPTSLIYDPNPWTSILRWHILKTEAQNLQTQNSKTK